MCPKQSLREVEKKFDYQIEKGMQALVMKMLALTKKDADLLSKENLVHLIKAR
jgi:phage-related minor tail protein